uniref:Uncharacterized protein n=1 Tax=Onchocerca volvulus TaxID=6282 RepID=A0A8R1TJ08_ONCVO
MWAVVAALLATLYLGYLCNAIPLYSGYSLLRFSTLTTDWLEQIEADGFALNNAS